MIINNQQPLVRSLLFMALFWVHAAHSTTVDESQALELLAQKKAFDALAGNIYIAGDVVDEHGDQLGDVILRVRCQCKDPDTFHDELKKAKTTVNGVFELALTNAVSVSLVFEKAGYYSEKLNYAVARGGQPSWGGKKELVEKGARVVLKKAGQLTELKSYSSPLKFSITGTATVGNLSGGPGVCRLKLDNVSDQDSWPSHGIYMTAQSVDGKLVTQSDIRPEHPQTPEGVRIRMCGERDGFVAFDANSKNDQHVYREMKVAPMSGYQNYLELTNSSGKTYFYVKVGEKYGKGSVAPIRRASNNGTYIRSFFQLYLQPDGSPNLEALDYH